MLAVRQALMSVRKEPLLDFTQARKLVKAMTAEQFDTFPSGMDLIQKALEELGEADEQPKPAT